MVNAALVIEAGKFSSFAISLQAFFLITYNEIIKNNNVVIIIIYYIIE